MARPAPSSLTREQSMAVKPVALPVASSQDLGNGGKRLTFHVTPSRFARVVLRLRGHVERRVELDPLGMEVFAMCDGQKNVRHIIDRFAKAHRLDPYEAERAVTVFLRTLTRKGLVELVSSKR